MNALPDPQAPKALEEMSATAFSIGAITDLRLRLHAAGYHPVPVLRHDANDKAAGKRPTMRGWETICLTVDDDKIRRWAKTLKGCTNTGILCGDLIGLDLDISDPALADKIETLADTLLPATPLVRVGKAPKSLRVFRADGVHRKVSTEVLFLPDGAKLQIEALGEGNQFVGFGTHPDTKQPYTWPAATPLDVARADLPRLSAPVLTGFLAAAEAVMRAAGARTAKEMEAGEKGAERASRQHETKRSAKPSVGRKSFPASTREDVASALAAVPNRHDWHGWMRIGAAIFDALADDGEGLFLDWSAQSPRNDPEAARAKWESFHTSPTTTKAATLFYEARQNGWRPDDVTRENAAGSPRNEKGKRERPKRAEREPAGSPVIRVVAGELHTITTAAEDALLSSGLPLFQRGNGLVQPISRDVPASRGRMTLAAGLGKMNVHSTTDLLCATAEWERYDARVEDWVRINPPKQVAEILLSREGKWRLPIVAGIITTPTLRPDGSLLVAPGYDPATRLYHVVDPTLKLDQSVNSPNKALAMKALTILESLLSDFPFVELKQTDGDAKQVAKAVALSGLITPIVRGAMAVAPLHAINAHTPGSGKSYLVDVASTIATGRPCPVIAAAPEEAETEKRITGLLLAGYPIISIDNCNGELGGDLLCQATERPLIRVRRLGGSEMFEIESTVTIFATGNNLRVRGDMVRRSLIAELDPKVERPELRNFKADPVAIVQADRGRYVSACLIIVRAYLAENSPGRLEPVASFTGWSDLVRSALVWLGCADPALSMEAAREDDPELGELREMVDAWVKSLGSNSAYTVRQVADEIAREYRTELGDHDQYVHPELREAVMRIAGDRGAVNTKRLGKWFLAREGRIVENHRFKRAAQQGHGGVVRWIAETLRQQ